MLRDLGIDHVQTVIQGIDTTHFHPGPRAGLFGDRFVVFSGGKLERRKGQDLVVQAFRAFAQRHSDARLVTAWTSPWPQLARSLEYNPSISPVLFRSDGQVDAVAWLETNGIPQRQVLDLGRVPNADMPRILREADVALFPNRAEGGTNLVAMECMACGLPTILSARTRKESPRYRSAPRPLCAEYANPHSGSAMPGLGRKQDRRDYRSARSGLS